MTNRCLLVAFGCVVCAGCEFFTAPPVAERKLGPPLTVRITGREFEWHIVYPGPDGEFETPDDVYTKQHLHLPESTPVTVELFSDDYVYSIYFPHVDLLEMTFPDHVFSLAFETDEPGKFELLGTQMCGFVHPNLIGDLVVHSTDGFEKWQADPGRVPPPIGEKLRDVR